MALLLAISCAMAAEEHPLLNVWPATAPGEKGDIGPEHMADASGNIQRLADVTKPTMTVYKPAKATDTGAAILICPGGGYSILAWDLEGTEIAQWCNSIGVTGIVLKYRVPARKGQEKHVAPLQDAQRALRLARAHAAEWQIDPERLGILGFSAGGHLSAVASTNSDKSAYEPIDETDKLSCRPDFTVLIYPAYLSAKDGLAPELRVGPNTPPAFLAHASDDGISSENSIAYYVALKRNKVPAELHLYVRGGHGYGLRDSANFVHTWPDRCADWMKAMRLLKKP